MACATAGVLVARAPREYACVGAPPEKEVFPEPRENGALIATLGRLLRRSAKGRIEGVSR